MGEVAHTTRPDFVISTGDNFYDCEIAVQGFCRYCCSRMCCASSLKSCTRRPAHKTTGLMPALLFCAAGLSSVQDDLFRSSFVDVYSSPSLKGVPWHAVLGYATVGLRSHYIVLCCWASHVCSITLLMPEVRLSNSNMSTVTMTMARAGCQRQRSARQPIPTASTARCTRSDVLQASDATSGPFDSGAAAYTFPVLPAERMLWELLYNWQSVSPSWMWDCARGTRGGIASAHSSCRWARARRRSSSSTPTRSSSPTATCPGPGKWVSTQAESSQSFIPSIARSSCSTAT